MKHMLTKGRYYVGDPALIISKTKQGSMFIEKLWDLFYKDMNKFHHLTIDNIEVYAMRTEGGDGYFDGIGTDTGVIIIMEMSQLEHHDFFDKDLKEQGCKFVTLETDTEAEVVNFNLDIKGYLKVETQ